MGNEKIVQENNERQDSYLDENKEVILGICFGTAVGVFGGALINNVMLGVSAGGVTGIIAGVVVNYYRRFKLKKGLRFRFYR